MALREIAEDLWTAEAEIAVAGMPLATRMTVIRRPDGSLILHSPIDIDDALADELDALGPVTQLLAPSRFHHLYLLGAERRWPDAKLWGAPGLPDKRRDLIFDEVLGDATPAALADTLDTRLFAGLPLASEVVVFHRRSKTLIVCDLVFNIHHSRSRASRWYLRASGAWQRCAQTPLIRALIRDRSAARRSLERIFEWDFERLIMAHGEIVERGARAVLADALVKLAPDLPR
ncbi:hypothetical protein ENSA5_01420 [Enhygromyxa salina]|uniref:DUF4336 domain-containing protein n=1 Tax=Enhygromyxa salina TaxID=215803 RepID=A0A2S9YLB5_9BACT|nr:DUF4336 domain-containing protein [Enhygromyxa salina]PRQ05822.1 hypothetical protein ENSA5_01420 [Enhygromyxa salina]